ncbi:MAG TPA: hypothetical protein PLI47_06825 [Bacteroidia bacterium]|nr:hypothetical protein [Bacteroidia bacterium]
MVTLNKNWNTGIASNKKFLSRLMTYFISLCIDNKKFDVVYEGRLSPTDFNEPDVVIYSGDIKTTPVVAIEISTEGELQKTYSNTKQLAVNSSLEELFIFIPETNRWLQYKKSDGTFSEVAQAETLSVPLYRFREWFSKSLSAA